MGNVHQACATLCAKGDESDVPSYPRLTVRIQRVQKCPACDGDLKSTDSKCGANGLTWFDFKTFEGRLLDIEEEAVDRMGKRQKVAVDRVRDLLTLMREVDVEGTQKLHTATLKYLEVSRKDKSNAETVTRLERLWENQRAASEPLTTLGVLIEDTRKIVYGCICDDQALSAQIGELTERAYKLRKRCRDVVAQ